MGTPRRFGRTTTALLASLALAAGTLVAATPAMAAPTTTARNAAVAAPAPAAAASGSVTISKIKGKKAPYNRTVTIKPQVRKSGKVVIAKKTLTVKRGSKTVAKNKTSVKLKAGTYRVTQKVTYRTFTNKVTSRKVERKVVGVEAYDDVNVTCVASGVEVEYLDSESDEPWGADVTLECTSPRFDGPLTFDAYLYYDDEEWWGYSNDDHYGFSTYSFSGTDGTIAGSLYSDEDLMLTKIVTEKKTKRVYSKVKTKSASQKLVITSGKKPSWVWGSGGWNCPAAYPIKGNASSMIYHVPGGAYYSRTKPEQCFATESAARAEGYRRSKR